MNDALEFLKLLISLRDSPLLLVTIIAIGLLALTGMSIYAVIVALKQGKK